MQANLPMEMETRRVTRLREVKLSISEAAEMGIEVGRLAGEIEEAKSAAKEAEKQQDELISTLKKNSVSKDVECEMKLFFATRTVQVFDGEELIEERAMSDEEFQVEMPLNHGVVMDSEESSEPMTEEEAKQDLEDTMRDERRADKPSLVDMKN